MWYSSSYSPFCYFSDSCIKSCLSFSASCFYCFCFQGLSSIVHAYSLCFIIFSFIIYHLSSIITCLFFFCFFFAFFLFFSIFPFLHFAIPDILLLLLFNFNVYVSFHLIFYFYFYINEFKLVDGTKRKLIVEYTNCLLYFQHSQHVQCPYADITFVKVDL